MLEVLIPGVRHGEAKIDTSAAYRGCWCYISGIDADNYHTLNVPTTTATAMRSVFPINKYRFEEDLSDSADAVDKLAKGDMVVYYDGGEYLTDKWDHSSFNINSTSWAASEGDLSTVYGRKIAVPGSSTAGGQVALWKCYVSTGVGRGGPGWLCGDIDVGSASAGLRLTNGFVGVAVGLYYTDSSDAKLRVRVEPGQGLFGSRSSIGGNVG
ncbi:MAG: hypothetical protein ACTSR4_03480 [Candidatus Hodarchaeales archaeon]